MPAKLTRAKVGTFEAHIRRRYDGVVFELMVTRNFLMGNVVELTTIVVRNRKQGTGTAIMRELCAFADRHGVEIRLTPASKGDYDATTSRARLIRYYKRFGFDTETSKHSDVTTARRMIRRPRH